MLTNIYNTHTSIKDKKEYNVLSFQMLKTRNGSYNKIT